MRLESIKLVGFKSFVDPTKVHFPSNLNGIVGPNGCGKSNIIDAVRWVMGESSAKQLRGENSTDVIFNGTVERQPVGQASIELIFDNSEGKLGGEYAKYNQISVKRQVNREAQSTYFLNGVKCRRRDVQDVFLGTGMGPRSYAIIEQGMISRLIEAKPEEMRVYLEEVSGISKYKERRRETENRIRHTRENLARLHDLREEIEKQLSHLKRQANAAERYKVLKEEQHGVQSKLYAVQWQNLAKQSEDVRQSLQAADINLEKQKAHVQSLDTQLVELREAKHDLLEKHNAVQKQYYDGGSEISRLEQAIKHQAEKREQLEKDLDNAIKEYQHLQTLIEQDSARKVTLEHESQGLKSTITAKEQTFNAMKEKLESAEASLQTWQESWDVFNARSADTAQKAQVEQTRIQHVEQKQSHQKQRIDRILEEEKLLRSEVGSDELEGLQSGLDELQNTAKENEAQYQQILDDLKTQREAEKNHRARLDELKEQLQSNKAKLASLETLQQEALSQKGEQVQSWLKAQGLDQNTPLAQRLEIEQGWEQAVEIALGSYLEAICVQDVKQFKTALSALSSGNLSFFMERTANVGDLPSNSLAHKIQSPSALRSELAHIIAVETLDDALAELDHLKPQQAVMTRDGVYLTANTLRVHKGEDENTGVIAREKSIKTLRQDVADLSKRVSELEGGLSESQASVQSIEAERETAQKAVSDAKASLADTKAKVEVKRSKIENATRRLDVLAQELSELREQFNQAHEELHSARSIWQEAMQAMEHDSRERETLLAERDRCRDALAEVRAEYQREQNELHRIQTSLESKETEAQSLTQSVERMRSQMQAIETRKSQFELALQHDDEPVESLQEKLQSLVAQHADIEKTLSASKQSLDTNEQSIYEIETQRRELENNIAETRQKLESQRMRVQEVEIRQSTLVERLQEMQADLQATIQLLTDEDQEKILSEALESVERRIERLGPINLAAIDEFSVQEERKVYIDQQYEDLEQALTTLENAIRKIDKETRQRFKDTFDAVNDYFKTYFPKIFGGGSAYMELTGEDLLDTGVAVMARPPGKKNASIHLLSGGEKALTAVALVFSLFQLNPAPFCMLDEVDAPLDDNNVTRFCNLVKEMSSKVQFIFISHNKLAIEMANQLIGVTMHEPGVSRIVAVDVEEAVSMAEA